MKLSNRLLLNYTQEFNNIYIIEDINYWDLCVLKCDKTLDLVLTLDFGLKQKLKSEGYNVEFMDHLADQFDLEEMNFKLHFFLDNWHKDENGKPILVYKNYNLGDALLLNIINEVTYFSHFFFNLLALKKLYFKQLSVYVKDPIIIVILNKIGFKYNLYNCNRSTDIQVYKFPIISWVKSKTSETFLFKIKNTFANLIDLIFLLIQRFRRRSPKHIYVQKYFPTDPIIPLLNKIKDYQIVLPNYSGLSSIFKYRRVFIQRNLASIDQTQSLILKYKNTPTHRWNYKGHNIDEMLKQLIIPILDIHLHKSMNIALSLDKWMKYFNLNLMVSVTNFWVTNRLLMQYCFSKKIPVLTIINGQLNTSFLYDAKDSDYVNCYSDSMRKNYFGNKKTVFSLGDPRMDKYSNLSFKEIDRSNPVIIIGTAGYDSTDLNSYLAYEFDFIYDILDSLLQLFNDGYSSKIIIKVRANGYIDMYENFVKKYFPQMNIFVVQNIPFVEIIKTGDLYISIFSQTLFEAACFGIPTIYYKNDSQFIHAPFDGNSELVTATNIDELKKVIKSFYLGDEIFDLFLDKKILEKYIGPLDGLNTKRNIEFINKLICEYSRAS
jgi:hypothetical protein